MTWLDKLKEKIEDYKRMIELDKLIEQSKDDYDILKLDNEYFNLRNKYHIDYFDDREDLKERLNELEKTLQPYKVTKPLF